MSRVLYTYQGKALTLSGSPGYFGFEYIPPPPNYFLSLDLTLIRNKEMNNIVGDAGSTDLSINAINGNILSVANLPNYEGFKKTNTWLAVPTVGSYVASPTMCTSINNVSKTITVFSAANFVVGDKIALYNPFLNYNFSGNQTSSPSISPSNLSGWGQQYTGSGPMFKVGSTYKWLFYGIEAATYKAAQIGLATSSDMATWTIQNNAGVWIPPSRLDCSSLSPTGDIGQIDGSYYCTISFNNKTTSRGEVRILFFDQDVSSLTWTGMLKDNAASGGVVKIGNEYHMLYLDISTAVANRNIRAAKASNIQGPYIDYQVNIVSGSSCPVGGTWNVACDSPTIHSINGNVFGLFGVQGNYYSAGVGNTNRQHALLNFDSSTQTWSLNIKGPVLMNPLQWNSVSGDYSWAIDHDGQGQCLLIDGSNSYLSNTFNSSSDTYRASMTKLKNFGDLVPSMSLSPSYKEYASGGSAQVFTVISNFPWDVSTNPAWITISSKTWQYGDGKFTATASSNGGSARSGQIVLKCTSSPDPYPSGFTIDVSQFTASDSISADYSELTFDGTGSPLGAEYVTLTSSGTWTASKVDTGDGTSWLTKLLPATGENTDICTPLVQSGYVGIGRSCTARFTVGTAHYDVTITQVGVI